MSSFKRSKMDVFLLGDFNETREEEEEQGAKVEKEKKQKTDVCIFIKT